MNQKSYLSELIIVILVGIIVFQHACGGEAPVQDNTVKDSLQAVIAVQDSIISILEIELATAPQVIETVKIKYHVKSNSIRNLPVDSGILFFTGWLSEEDSNR
jgi:hypothetical protein